MTGATFGQSPHMTMAQAASYFQKPTADAMYRWCLRHGITLYGSSRKWLVDRRDVEAKLRAVRRVA